MLQDGADGVQRVGEDVFLLANDSDVGDAVVVEVQTDLRHVDVEPQTERAVVNDSVMYFLPAGHIDAPLGEGCVHPSENRRQHDHRHLARCPVVRPRHLNSIRGT